MKQYQIDKKVKAEPTLLKKKPNKNTNVHNRLFKRNGKKSIKSFART